MNISSFFIERPIFAGVIAVFITLIGAFCYPLLPLSQYPEIAPPTIAVQATYSGASPETIAETVATPLEQEINGVEGMLYMSSSSTQGAAQITVTFKPGTDLDAAQVLVQNRVRLAEPRLEQGRIEPGQDLPAFDGRVEVGVEALHGPRDLRAHLHGGDRLQGARGAHGFDHVAPFDLGGGVFRDRRPALEGIKRERPGRQHQGRDEHTT